MNGFGYELSPESIEGALFYFILCSLGICLKDMASHDHSWCLVLGALLLRLQTPSKPDKHLLVFSTIPIIFTLHI